MLLGDLLFDRVFAMKIRGFAQQFRRAELNMHFSLSSDLVPVEKFFDTLRKETRLAVMIERGTI